MDVEDVIINYPSIWELMADLRDMGESNAILGRKTHISRDVLLAAEAIYKGKSPKHLCHIDQADIGSQNCMARKMGRASLQLFKSFSW